MEGVGLCYHEYMGMTKLKFKWPNKSALSKGAFAIIKKLRNSGFDAYVAGGAVRDAVLKIPIKEIDIATSALPSGVYFYRLQSGAFIKTAKMVMMK